MSEHAHPTVKTFVVVWAALLVLTALTVFAATLELGPFNAIVALTHCDREGAAGAAVLHGTALLDGADQGCGGCGHLLPDAAGWG